MKLTGFVKNCMGTICFSGKFDGMRKAQEFTVYPLAGGDAADKITIQSDTRIGTVRLNDGEVRLSPSVQSGAYFYHLSLAKAVTALTAEELVFLKANVFATAASAAGTHGVTCDNTSALEVLA